MSMPKFPNHDTILSREEAINAIITSIAMEETALSHILSAESEKIKYLTKHINHGSCDDIKMLLAVNESVSSLIERVNDMQLILKNKLRLAVSCLPEPPKPVPPIPPCPPPKPCPPCPPCPPPKPHPPCPPCPPPKPHNPCPPGVIQPCPKESDPCTAVFSASAKYRWSGRRSLRLEKNSCCENGTSVCHKGCDTLIRFPMCKKYRIELDLDLINRSSCPALIEVKITCGDKTVFLKEYSYESEKRCICIQDIPIKKTPLGKKAHMMSIKLLSQKSLEIRRGNVFITEILD